MEKVSERYGGGVEVFEGPLYPGEGDYVIAERTREEGGYPEEERVYGEYQMAKVSVDSLVRLPQVRPGLNPDLPDLKDSIKRTGRLLNPIDIAVMDRTALGEYINFTNRLWGKDVRLEDYAHLEQPGGSYNLVIAGHTRVEAISQLQAEDETGRPYKIMCKVHEATDPHSIISLQLDENIHSKPSQERRAMAIVEAWLYGVENGLWKTKKAFVDKNKNKFNEKNLNDAIAFSQLPSEVRDFVFEGNVPYAASVELGKSVKTIKQYAALKMGNVETEDSKDELLDEAYRMKIGSLIQYVFSRSMGVGAATKYISDQAKAMREALGLAASQPEIVLFSPAELHSMGYDQIKKEYLNAVRETNELAREKREKQLRLQHELTRAAELSWILEQVRDEAFQVSAAA